MAKVKKLQERLQMRLDREMRDFEDLTDDLVIKVRANLVTDEIEEVGTGYLALRRLTKSQTFSGFLKKLTGYVTVGAGEFADMTNPAVLTAAFDLGDDYQEMDIWLRYSPDDMPYPAHVKIRLLSDLEGDAAHVFLYILNGTYDWVVDRGLMALQDKQHYAFYCIQADTGSYVPFPNTGGHRSVPHTDYDDTVVAVRDTILQYPDKVAEQMGLRYIKKQLQDASFFGLAFSTVSGGKVRHHYYRYSYMDANKRFILLTHVDITDIVVQDPEDAGPVFAGEVKRFLSFSSDRPHAERANTQLNEVLGLKVGDEKNYDFSGKTVLLAEDHAINIEVAKSMLEGLGFSVDVAVNGQKAVEKFNESEEDTYACILMDVNMPVKDGITATKEIRKAKRKDADKVPIVALMATVFEEDIAMVNKAGMNAHLAKPINPQRLLKTLESII